MKTLDEAFAIGYECLSARADLLDQINVFPVADSDTGTNLRISMGPLRACRKNRAEAAAQLSRCATGNSGNIAAAFFGELLRAESLADLPEKTEKGRASAWQAVATPELGTMLSVFDRLAEILASLPLEGEYCAAVLSALQETVLATTQTLPNLRLAGVVDSGALGMYVFFDGFFRTVTGYSENNRSLFDLFPGRLAVSADYRPESSDAYCVDVIVRPAIGETFSKEQVAALGESVVVVRDQSQIKIHIHTSDPGELRARLTEMGEVTHWADEPLGLKKGASLAAHNRLGRLHIMTDAAGSLPRYLARLHNITLLDSYIVTGESARPESLCLPEKIYALMLEGHRVTTAQASLSERQQLFRGVCEQFGRTLYLCVGSAFTGNYATAAAWKDRYDSDGLLEVIDTGAASGRLGIIALLTARYAEKAESADEVVTYARFLVDNCREYVFIDKLRYLVAGGRVSRANGFFGDLLHLKPIVTPTREGVQKVGLVRSRQAQLSFTMEKLVAETEEGNACVLLQYSDNRAWVAEVVQPQLQKILPHAEVILVPLSLTSGVHMGPGTWSLAFAPQGII